MTYTSYVTTRSPCTDSVVVILTMAFQIVVNHWHLQLRGIDTRMDDATMLSVSNPRDDIFTHTSVKYRYANAAHVGDGTYYGPNDDKYASYEMIVYVSSLHLVPTLFARTLGRKRQLLTWACRHHLWLLTLDDKLFLAPIENPEMILDVGTGTGLWAV